MAKSQISEDGTSASSPVPRFFSGPRLTDNNTYHIFVSFSSADSPWVHQLIHKLEVIFPSIKICTHDRDFTAGKTILENMTECIQRSQIIIMVLSPDFVHSRWCLFEANLSMFQDCMSHQAIVPVMLKPCPMPLYLSHLTYLEVEDEQFFEKLCNRLLKNNAKETDDVLLHYQSSLLYGGKHLLSLAAVNDNDEGANNGVFSDTFVPDSLKAVVKDPEIYKKAIRLINETPIDFLFVIRTKSERCIYLILALYVAFMMTMTLHMFIYAYYFKNWWSCMHLPGYVIPGFLALYKLNHWDKRRVEEVTRTMSRRTGEANLLLAETSVLAGWASKFSLVFVFASLKKCKAMFHMTFGYDNELTKCMWEKAMIKHSSNYANCMAKKYFPCGDPEPPGHLANGICFCQYVSMQIKQGDWP